jgi:hypothetical protein
MSKTVIVDGFEIDVHGRVARHLETGASASLDEYRDHNGKLLHYLRANKRAGEDGRHLTPEQERRSPWFSIGWRRYGNDRYHC